MRFNIQLYAGKIKDDTDIMGQIYTATHYRRYKNINENIGNVKKYLTNHKIYSELNTIIHNKSFTGQYRFFEEIEVENCDEFYKAYQTLPNYDRNSYVPFSERKVFYKNLNIEKKVYDLKSEGKTKIYLNTNPEYYIYLYSFKLKGSFELLSSYEYNTPMQYYYSKKDISFKKVNNLVYPDIDKEENFVGKFNFTLPISIYIREISK